MSVFDHLTRQLFFFFFFFGGGGGCGKGAGASLCREETDYQNGFWSSRDSRRETIKLFSFVK